MIGINQFEDDGVEHFDVQPDDPSDESCDDQPDDQPQNHPEVQLNNSNWIPLLNPAPPESHIHLTFFLLGLLDVAAPYSLETEGLTELEIILGVLDHFRSLGMFFYGPHNRHHREDDVIDR